MHGTAAAKAIERERVARSRARHVLFDARARRGQRRGPGGASDTYQAGLFGEEVVADRLVSQGWRLLGHRVRLHVGELDLVARRGDTIVFAEVKTARPGRRGVEESVDGRARHRIRRAAIAWMTINPKLQRGVRRYRFDVFIVRRDADGVVTGIEQIEDAF